MILFGALLAIASPTRHAPMAPASEGAIVAGVEACLKATGRSPAKDALDGWRPAPAGSFRTDGRAVARDNVIMAITTGQGGACMIVARGDANFHGLALLRDLETRFGADLRSDAPPVLHLPDGRLMRLNIGAKDNGPTYIQLAIASAKGK